MQLIGYLHPTYYVMFEGKISLHIEVKVLERVLGTAAGIQTYKNVLYTIR